ncbi:RNA polymerase sigma factor [Paenibacillus agilis]|nr:sigma-70 family RNA polymerase sigma factor [Paenibacillus agilis]
MVEKLLLLQIHDFKSMETETQGEIYAQYYHLFYTQIFYMTREHFMTEDIIQESFLRVIKYFPKVCDSEKLKAWLKTVIKNTTLNYLKKEKRARECIENDILDHIAIIEGVEREFELKAMIEVVEKYLIELKPEYRQLIELRWKEEMSHKDIANMLGISEQKAKYTLCRARKSIKKRVVKEWPFFNSSK